MKLQGQHILVTGASKGIGYAIADHLLQHKARVGVHFHSGESAAQSLASRYGEKQVSALKADLSKSEEVPGLFSSALESLGSIDTLVLNAGVFIPHPMDMDVREWYRIWKQTLAVNLDSVGLLTKLALDYFMEKKEGRIIYIGSRAAFRGETEEYLAYAASKGGLTSLARSVARSFGKYNIKAFVVAPGFTRTAMAEQFIGEYGEARVLEELSLNELTEATDIAPLVGFMASGAMDHATGTTIDINAGSYIH
ncbi:SDR family NAD(P)-dependent oxidoreductase [Muriicola marianensis]|uniref:NAD-dependent epimerase n=1 Tax=Muriicola marianensis TaxID=1324801 RepID=A0ABQ1QP98_9FLAO|nr:SDR family oxidoreductase [Muriicola marianensis]GGD39095.1 NAD-dependent epimerase [Muriicola marianensis]